MIFHVDKDLSEQKDVDNGPNIIGHLNPEVLRTSYKKPVGWTCEAVGASVTYGWMKNYNVSFILKVIFKVLIEFCYLIH